MALNSAGFIFSKFNQNKIIKMDDPQSKHSILVVEDDESNRIIYSEFLKQNGFHVAVAEDGEVALKRLAESHFDFVLLDIMIPKVDGIKVLQAIKSDPMKRNIKVYMLTVLGTDTMIRKAFEAGADGYLLKDTLSPEDIKNEIVLALNKDPKRTPL